jgi:flagellar basal-body rod protein FlgG
VAVIFQENTVPQNIGQIQLVSFVNPAGLKSLGGNLFIPSNSSGLPQQGVPGQNGLGSLAQGQLETSNVNIVDEMVNMITAQRAYETNSKAVQAADQMLQAVNGLR